MRHDLLGLPLELALERLKAEGITPEVQVTRFLDPIAAG